MTPETEGRAAFLAFLLRAKRHTYAGQGDDATVTPVLPGSKQLEYREGDYAYRDILSARPTSSARRSSRSAARRCGR